MVISSEKKELSGKNRKEIREAIMNAYPSISKLKIMVDEELDRNLDEIGGSNLEEVVFNLIKTADSCGWVKELTIGACNSNPGNEQLKILKEKLFPQLSDSISKEENQFSVIGEKWNELLTILSEIDLPIISDICKDTIKYLNPNIDIFANYSELINLEKIGTLKKILLENSTPPVTEAETIVQFVERLSNAEGVKVSERNKLCNLKEALGDKYNIDLPTYEKKKSFNNLDFYLLVTAIPKGNNQFNLTAELILDKEIIPIDELNYEQREIDCTLSEIATKIYEFIKIGQKNALRQYKNYTLTIELFMPLQYLDEKIDTQEIPAGFGEKIAIGDKYQFIIRCSERITEEGGEFLMELHRKYENFSHKFEDIPEKNSYQEWDWDNCNLKKLENNWLDKGILGTTIICGLPEKNEVKRKFFISLIRGGVPICLWTRGSNLQDTEDGFNEIFSYKLKSMNDLNTLFKSVWHIRRKAHAQTNKQDYLGYNLGFLCDNPYRIPSSLDPELSELYELGE